MENYDDVASLLKVMGHPIRLQILDMLRKGETCVCHIERALDKRQAYISQQLMTLRDAGLVETRKDGVQVHYRLSDDTVLSVLNQVFGGADAQGLDIIPDCNCPICSTVLLTDIKPIGE